MKKILILLSFMFFVFANQAYTQVEDPLNQSNLKVHGEWSTEAEVQITKKKKEQKTEQKTEVIESKQVVKEQVQPVKSMVVVSNSCPEEMTVEFVSLKGNKASQEVTLTVKLTDHDINGTRYIKNFLAFNQEGKSFSHYSIGNYNTLTDIPQNISCVVGRMLPSKNSKLTAVSFTVSGCSIEFRDVPIDWK